MPTTSQCLKSCCLHGNVPMSEHNSRLIISQYLSVRNLEMTEQELCSDFGIFKFTQQLSDIAVAT